MFKIIGGKGFHVTFENGVTVSVQFGYGSYCNKYPDNEDMFNEDLSYRENWKDPLPVNGSPDAEIGIWDKNDKWITRKYIKQVLKDKDYGDDVLGFQNAEHVLWALNWAKNYKPRKAEL